MHGTITEKDKLVKKMHHYLSGPRATRATMQSARADNLNSQVALRAGRSIISANSIQGKEVEKGFLGIPRGR